MTLTLDLMIFSLQTGGGISVQWAEYLKRLIKTVTHEDLELKLLLPENQNTVLEKLVLPHQLVIKQSRVSSFMKYFPSFYRGNPNEILHMSYYRSYPFFRGKRVVTVHDFIHHYYMPPLKSKPHEHLKWLSLRSADVIVCVSEATKADMLRIYPDLARHDIRVITPAATAEDFYYEPSSSEAKEPYLIWVGGRAGYKNFSGGLVALRKARQTWPNLKLRVVGAPLDAAEEAEIASKGLQDAVIMEPRATQERLRGLYSGALALLYLSHYEGFGLPILEAQRCRCPVICLPTAAAKEVGQDSIFYISESMDEIPHILNLLSDPNQREAILEAGKTNEARYSWDRSYQKFYKLYRELGWSQAMPS